MPTVSCRESFAGTYFLPRNISEQDAEGGFELTGFATVSNDFSSDQYEVDVQLRLEREGGGLDAIASDTFTVGAFESIEVQVTGQVPGRPAGDYVVSMAKTGERNLGGE